MRLETRVAVLGGGVTGLCTAHFLSKTLGAENVRLLEASDYIGGTTRTENINGLLCDWGPNGFLNREPLTLDWIDDLGLTHELIAANEAAARRFIFKNGKLVEIVGPPRFLVSSLLSPAGRARLFCEPFIKQRTSDEPETIWNFAARRIGAEAADTLVSAMVLGVFGGDAKQLSLAHCFPRMAAMEREFGTLFKALMAKRRQSSGASPMGPGGVLTTFQQGIGRLPEYAAQSMRAQIVAEARVSSLTRDNGVFRIRTDRDDCVEAEKVVMAIPAYEAAKAVQNLVPAAAKELARIAYADIAVLCTAYRREQVGHSLDGFGFLVPPSQGKQVLGCLWTSSIFPHQAPNGMVLLRTMVGGYANPAPVKWSDSELLALLDREIHPLLDVHGSPEFVRIFRHIRGIPQYLLHHGESLAAVEAAERECPGLVFAGNAFRGVGLNDCVVSAHRAVDLLSK
ncbi:MAG: protoporphyrinogen oxidase [Candidatus Hydrogenedentes bacterium]|nr:protoporphyrinogen oxidase [Candidatus Hydrogenedentota bacterium]